MNMKLKKTKLKSLTKSSNSIADSMTPNIAGGSSYASYRCLPDTAACNNDSMDCHTAPSPDQFCVITGTSGPAPM
ncbi:hypothetical protein L1077_03095 [Pseudoalteromonas luteoviolacea]|uniref:hypothetical protein n=1 Tax=Pseudoalteromonas luteoviolacea TaxID=43657 RepID=UPI001F16CB12|nr:hypothetical protein [Pseudoalteromonas luteoviolacea]MCF6438416.1 hypothetical protein [Pseudoalteromonas luteoviolacea]